MVSTRAPKNFFFEKGEKVLCYEPDPTKAKVLYDSKILGTYETKDKRGRKLIQYKVHFQGWSSSWDRKVNADFILKDTEENRQLQRDLAEKAQLFLGAYLYRKDRSATKKRSRKPTALTNESTAANVNISPKRRPRGSSEDNFSSGSTIEKSEFNMKDDEGDTESCCSSIESFHDEERVMLRVSERLRQYLEYDYDMIVKNSKRHVLPCRVPAISILENFVQQSAMKLIFSTAQTESTRRRIVQRADKKERELDKIIATISLLKEVADGLRIYFDFTISDYLLYKEEKEYALSYLSEDSLKNFSYVVTPTVLPDILNTKSEPETTSISTDVTCDNIANVGVIVEPTSTGYDEPQKRKLRSYRSDDCDFMFENCLSSIASTSSGASTPLHPNTSGANISYFKSFPQQAQGIPPQAKEFLQNIFTWRLLPTNATPAPSMIFGAPHLARLIVKFPEFLNASSLNDAKLKLLLLHLDAFTNFLESHKEWFNEDNYSRYTTGRSPNTANPAVVPILKINGTVQNKQQEYQEQEQEQQRTQPKPESEAEQSQQPKQSLQLQQSKPPLQQTLPKHSAEGQRSTQREVSLTTAIANTAEEPPVMVSNVVT